MLKTILLLGLIVTLGHAQEERFRRPPRPGSNFGNYGHRRPPPPPRPPHRGEGSLSFPEYSGESFQDPMQVLYSWKQVDFTFPNDATRQNMIQNGQFIPINNLILDVDVYEDQYTRKVFVTLPRVRPGVPVTLATVTTGRRNGAHLLAPYPDWRSQQPGDCNNGITSVFRTHMDECGRLWVLDSGNNNVFNGANSSIVCPPQVLIYDVRNSNRLIGKYRIPSSMIADNTLLVTIAVDVRTQDCSDAFAYIADSIAYKLIVFNFRTGEFWRINSILFFPYPDFSRFNVNGVSFDLSGGIFGLALGPLYRGNRRLYFHCIDSVKQSWADTADLRDPSIWRNNMNANPRAFNLFNGTRPSQSAAATMDPEGLMFYGLIGSNEIACWNSQTKFDRANMVVLAKNDVTLQFNSGIKVYGNKLYAATSRLQNYVTRQVKPDEENYRVLVGNVQEMIRGTQCEVNYLGDRFDTDYSPDSESVDHPNHIEFTFAPN